MRTEDVSIRALLLDASSQGMSIEQATEHVYAEFFRGVRAPYRQVARDYFYPILYNEARMAVRSFVRGREQEVSRVVADGGTVAQARKILAGLAFADPETGEYVEWGKATAEQHRRRASQQRKMARALMGDADLHDRAADEIEAAGVSCLDEIEERAA